MNLKKGGEFMNLGDKLLKLRKDNKMSQEEFAEALDVTIDDLLDKENLKRGASIQKKYDQLNPVHQNIINETIDAYLCKENKGTIIS